MSKAVVVIPSWNAREHLAACLESVLEEIRDPSEIFVVENGSSDGSVGLLRDLDVPHVALDANIGFAAAVNLGVARTKADFVFVLNCDTLLREGALRRLIGALDRDPGLGGVQPRILQLGSDPPTIYSAGQTLRRDGRAFESGAGDADGPDHRTEREIFGVCGAACLLRRRLFTELGGYDERYFAFHEDVDLNARARLAGWRFDYVPEAVVLHAGGATWNAAKSPLRFNTRLMARNRLATNVKVLPTRSFPRMVVAELGSLVRAAQRGTLGAALRGRAEALGWLPRLLAERRALRRGGRRDYLATWLR